MLERIMKLVSKVNSFLFKIIEVEFTVRNGISKPGTFLIDIMKSGWKILKMDFI